MKVLLELTLADITSSDKCRSARSNATKGIKNRDNARSRTKKPYNENIVASRALMFSYRAFHTFWARLRTMRCFS